MSAQRPTICPCPQEIERAKAQAGEDEALDVEAKRLAHARSWAGWRASWKRRWMRLGLRRRRRSGGAPTGRSVPRQMAGAARCPVANADELAQSARDYAGSIEADPGRLATVEQRRDLLFRLQQKHGATIADVWPPATRRRASWSCSTPRISICANCGGSRAVRRRVQARDGSAQREAGGRSKKLARAVNKVSASAGHGRWAVRGVAVRRTAHGVRRTRCGDVVFRVKLNEGLEPRPLARVASGASSRVSCSP